MSSQDPPVLNPDLTRRELMAGTARLGAVVVALEVLSACGEPAEEDPTASPTPTSVPLPEPETSLQVTLKVNGQDQLLTLEPRATLAEALRDTLKLTGTRIGCNRAACGACTVHLDGLPVLACSMLAVEAVGKAIHTIESLADGETLHPLQEAFVAHDGLQCGFCTPGMLMSCKALLDTKADPTEDDVRAATAGNLCRCGTYPRVFSATVAAGAALRTSPETSVGTRMTRLEAREKVTGAAQYTHDISLDGLLHGVVLRSPHPAAVVQKVNKDKALAMPGVKAVLAWEEKVIRYAGDEVAAIAAERLEQALDALAVLEVEYEVSPFVVTVDDAMASGAPRVFSNRSNVSVARTSTAGDVTAGFAEATAIVEAEVRTQVQTHASLETHSCVAWWEDEDHLTTWFSTQATFGTRTDLATYFGLSRENVRVLCQYMGGGFGSKVGAGSYGTICAELAREAGAPVKLLLDRESEHLNTGNRPDSIQQLKIGARADGSLSAVQLYGYATPGVGSGAGFGEPAQNLYTCPNFRVDEVTVYTNCGPAATMRAPGYPQGVFAMEAVLDDVADALGMDPLEFRSKNNSIPTREKEIRLAAERFGWDKRSLEHGADKGRYKRGMGMATCTWTSGSWANYEVDVSISPDGDVHVMSGVQDIGTGCRTWMAALVADALGLPLDGVRISIGDTAYPFASMSAGSTTTPSMAPPSRHAGMLARDALAALAGPVLQADPAALVFADGQITAPDGGSLSFGEACQLLSAPQTFTGTFREVPLEGGLTTGVQLAEVEVDTRTGVVRVVRVVAVHDAGTILNPLTAESQIIGGVTQGIHYALFEERVMDRGSGLMLNANLETYKIGGSEDIPQIEPILLATDVGEQYVGALGLGEPPVIPTAPAIRNAIKNATGAKLYRIPMTPARVLEALGVVTAASGRKAGRARRPGRKS